MPDCVVVIVNWNSWGYLFHCLDALMEQTFQDFRIIIIDNNSSDQSPAVKLEKYPRITFIQNSENIGFAAANNQAIKSAEDCEWVVLLNPDTVPQKDWLEKLRQASRSYPDYSFFGSLLVMAKDKQKLDGTGDVYHMSGLTWRAGHGVDAEAVDLKPQEIFSPCAAAAMYRRNDFLDIGGFDEDFFCYNEDVDLGFRLRLAGHRALSIPDSVVLHYGSATTSRRSDFAVYHGHRNLVWTWFKDMPIALLLLFFPLHVVYNLACIVLYALRGQGKTILQSKWDAVKGLPQMLKKRRNLQNGVALNDIWKSINKSLLVGPKSKYSKTV